MKITFFPLFLLLLASSAQPQVVRLSNSDISSACFQKQRAEGLIITKNLDLGISLGFNTVFRPIYDVSISPLDHSVQVTKESTTSFLISTGVLYTFPGQKKQKAAKIKRLIISASRQTKLTAVRNTKCQVDGVLLLRLTWQLSIPQETEVSSTAQ
ncbi:MAG: hypothetical protein LCH51_03300 [Bacteroidetes bacterium]|nr:hypothetical protein [Bacteroidota bacterium]